MSFSSTVKRELVKFKLRSDAVRHAQLAGLTHAAGILRLGRVLGVDYSTETHDVGLQIASLATALYDVNAQVAVRSSDQRRLMLTTVSLTGAGIESMLSDMGLFHRSEAGVELFHTIPAQAIASRACRKAFLRGVFLSAGSLSNPVRAYHLEIVCGNEALAQALCVLMEEFKVDAKTVRRKEKTVVYLKEGNRIASFLAWINAPVATLKFEDARAEHELRNYINRTSNCETANIGKIVYAAGEQMDAINKIQAILGLERLSPILRETAELRLNNPDLSLQELAELAGIGKSGMNHRLQRLLRFAEQLN